MSTPEGTILIGEARRTCRPQTFLDRLKSIHVDYFYALLVKTKQQNLKLYILV